MRSSRPAGGRTIGLVADDGRAPRGPRRALRRGAGRMRHRRRERSSSTRRSSPIPPISTRYPRDLDADARGRGRMRASTSLFAPTAERALPAGLRDLGRARRRGCGARGRAPARPLPRRRDGLREALQHRQARRRLLRPQGRPAGRGREAGRARPRPRRSRSASSTTVRDADGLALSSRNTRLSPEERESALAIPRALATRDAARARALLVAAGLEPEYVEVADLDGPTLAVAVRVGATRLIDNVLLEGATHDEHPRPTHRKAAAARARRDEAAAATRSSMVTAYDAPAARLADEAGVELILVGDTAAMVMLGHESTIPVTLDEMIFLTRAVTRSARQPLVVGDLPFGTLRDLRRAGGRQRDPAGQGGRRRRRQARGRRPDGLARARDRRVEHRDHGPHRPDAAVGDEARRLPRPGAQRRRRRSKLYDDALALAGRRLLRARARGGAGASRGADHGGARRSRRSASARGPTATARCSSGTTCSGSTTGRRRASSSATPSSPARSAMRSSATSTDVRSGAFPEEQHTYSIPEAELASFEAELEATPARGLGAAGPTTAIATAPQPARSQRPAVHGADADHEQRRRPRRGTRAASSAKTAAAGARVGAAAMEERRAVERRASPARARARARSARTRTRGDGACGGRCRASRAPEHARAGSRRRSSTRRAPYMPPAMKRPDGDEQAVVVVVVEQVAAVEVASTPAIPPSQMISEHRLGAVADRLGRVVRAARRTPRAGPAGRAASGATSRARSEPSPRAAA